jgi:hypothetical protein
MLRRSIAVSFALAACCILPASAPAAAPLTPAGWRVDPAGTEIAVMWGAFVNKPGLTPYQAIQPKIVPFGDPGAPVNGTSAPMAAQAAKWNFKDADETPEIGLNEAIWKSVKGGTRRCRARATRIVGSRPNDEDEAGAGRPAAGGQRAAADADG